MNFCECCPCCLDILWMCLIHRHLSNACLVCFISTVNGIDSWWVQLSMLMATTKKINKKPWNPGASSGHITNLNQSILDFRCLWFDNGHDKTTFWFRIKEDSFVIRKIIQNRRGTVQLFVEMPETICGHFKISINLFHCKNDLRLFLKTRLKKMQFR